MQTKIIGYIFIVLASVIAIFLIFLSDPSKLIFPSGPDFICKIVGYNQKYIWSGQDSWLAKYGPAYAPTCFDELSEEKMLFLVKITFTLFVLILGIIILIQRFHWHRWYLSSFFIVTSIILFSQAVYFSSPRHLFSDSEDLIFGIGPAIPGLIQSLAIPIFLAGIIIMFHKNWRWYVAILFPSFFLPFLIFKLTSDIFTQAFSLIAATIGLIKLFFYWKKSRKAQEVNTLNPPTNTL